MTEQQGAEILTKLDQLLYATEYVIVYLGVAIFFLVLCALVRWKG